MDDRLWINTYNKPGELSTWRDWRLIPVTSQENYLSFSGHRLIPVTCQENYLNDRQFSNSRLTPETRRENYLYLLGQRLIHETRHDNYLWIVDYRLTPETRQENYLWTTDCRLTPETRQESYLHDQTKQSYTIFFSYSLTRAHLETTLHRLFLIPFQIMANSIIHSKSLETWISTRIKQTVISLEINLQQSLR